MELYNNRGQQNTINEALQVDLPDHAAISVAGAGGKTSLIFAWAGELAAAGRKVMVTTTTHMMHPEFADDDYSCPALIYPPDYSPSESSLDEDREKLNALLDEHGMVMIAAADPDNERKVTAPPGELLEYVYETADIVLTEADGSRRMPLKWPRSHEPAIPENTDITVFVCGLGSLGADVSDAVYNSEELPSFLRIKPVDEETIAFIASSPEGGLKDSYGEYRVFLNQADTNELQEKAAYIQKLLAVRGIQSAWGKLR